MVEEVRQIAQREGDSQSTVIRRLIRFGLDVERSNGQRVGRP